MMEIVTQVTFTHESGCVADKVM